MSKKRFCSYLKPFGNRKKRTKWLLESFHRRVKKDLFDTKYIADLKQKVKDKIIDKTELKKEILKLLNTYVLNFNNYWYLSYKPRYELFYYDERK